MFQYRIKERCVLKFRQFADMGYKVISKGNTTRINNTGRFVEAVCFEIDLPK